MANQTAARDADRQEGVLVDVLHNDNTIYKGALVTVDTNGYAHAAESGKAFIGVAMEDTPTDGREYIRVYTEGVAQFDGAGFTQADTGKLVTVGSDDHSVALAKDGDDAPAANEIVGKIINVISATSVRVKL